MITPGAARRTSTAVSGGCAVLALLLTSIKLIAQPPSFPSKVELVTVDLVVTDKDGRPMSGLGRDTFTLFEDGRRQAIATFEAVEILTGPPGPATAEPGGVPTAAPTEPRRTFALVFDDLHLEPFQADRVKTALVRFVETAAAAGDLVALIAPGAGLSKAGQLPSTREQILAALATLRGLRKPDRSSDALSDKEAYEISAGNDEVLERVIERVQARDPLGAGAFVRAKAAQVRAEARVRDEALLGVLSKTLTWLGGLKGRKSLVLASPGFVYEQTLRGYGEVLRASLRANAPLYCLDARGLEGLTPFQDVESQRVQDPGKIAPHAFDRQDAAEGADSLAIDTGGFTIRNTNDFARGLGEIADASRAYYLLGYYPTSDRRDGRFRRIEVEVAVKGLSVRARRGYFAPKEDVPAGRR